MRLFRLDRISHARLVRERFEPPADFDVDDLVSGSWGIWQAEDHDEVVLRFTAAAAARVRQSFWHRSAQLTDLENGGVELRLNVASEVEMRPWVLGWGAPGRGAGPALAPRARRRLDGRPERGSTPAADRPARG